MINYQIKKNVLIYGAGEAGRQLLSSLENSREYNVEGFIDDNTQLHRRVLLDKTIFPLSNLKKLIQLKNINLVLLLYHLLEGVSEIKLLKN